MCVIFISLSSHGENMLQCGLWRLVSDTLSGQTNLEKLENLLIPDSFFLFLNLEKFNGRKTGIFT